MCIATFPCDEKSVYRVNRLQNVNMPFMERRKCGHVLAVHLQNNKAKQVKKIPDSLRPASSRTNQSSLTCVYAGGRLSSRIRFSNIGLVSEIAILVLATAVGTLTSAGNWMRSRTVTNTNIQSGIIVEIKLGHLHLQ